MEHSPTLRDFQEVVKHIDPVVGVVRCLCVYLFTCLPVYLFTKYAAAQKLTEFRDSEGRLSFARG